MCLLWFLYGHRRFQFTPVPDDYPPEGSMRFMRGEPADYEHFPPNFLRYEFGANWYESDPLAIRLSPMVMEELCRTKRVLTVIRSEEASHEKRRPPPLLFTEKYFQLLQKMRPSVSTYMETKQQLAYLTLEYDREVIPIYDIFQLSPGCYFDFYVFEPEEVKDAKTALEKVKTFQYDLKLDYRKWGPVQLTVDLNQDTVDAAAVEAAVKKVCAEQGILLMNPEL